MIRSHNWTDLLTNFIQSRRNTPFVWGKNDCCLFPADAVLAMTGEDKAADFRGTYNSAIGAKRALKKKGYSNIEEALTSILGAPVSRLSVRRGDVVLVDYEGQEVAGVMYGQVLVPGVDQLATVSPLNIKKVWRVA